MALFLAFVRAKLSCRLTVLPFEVLLLLILTFNVAIYLIIIDFQMRCPHGKKVKIYKRAKLEKFAHYLMKDGLISKLSVYDNRECK